MREVATCQACASALPDSARFCPACGAAAGHGPESPTFTAAGVIVRAAGPAQVAAATPANILSGRFVPGTVLAGRYRVIGLLGRGGMGEVYRADDLLLEQPVALKFLPLDLSTDPARLTRFRGELRAARQVSHPNVCRVYDIGEADGYQFLSMEYVDGEDLASLLRRIGRLPQDKGVEVARQICAGLAAAHERGVLHRDLKPANVMLDGRGQVRIADFGLAGAAASEEAPAGTPSYMAPEQFALQPATVQSDLYALGLLLYELFTGKAVYAPGSLLAVAQAHRERKPSSATTEVADLDPAIDRVIQRCLASDPRARPASALQVAASLPGGDPLAAALARGETPSPAMVAAAGGEGTLRPVVALVLWLVVAAGLIAAVPLAERINPIRAIETPPPPEVLRDRARQIIRQAGYTDPPADTTGGFVPRAVVLRYLAQLPAADRWNQMRRDSPVVFWYRESPQDLVNFSAFDTRVSTYMPPLTEGGMTALWLDSRGKLVRFLALPDRVIGDSISGPIDWRPLFNAAGLEQSEFRESTARLRPLFHQADVLVAWVRAGAGNSDGPTRIEAAATGTKASYFQVFLPWEGSGDPIPSVRPTGLKRIPTIFPIVTTLLLVIAAVLLTVHNLRTRRGDIRGATRVAIVMFCAMVCHSALASDYAAGVGILFNLLANIAAQGMLVAGCIWAGYVAIEPHVRRWWPETLISWTRLVDGRWRDPRVGRDVLIGMTFAAVAYSALVTVSLGSSWPAMTSQRLLSVWMLDGGRFFAAWLIGTQLRWFARSVSTLLLLLVLTVLTRRKRVAFVSTFVLLAPAAFTIFGVGSLLENLTTLAFMASSIALLARVGFLASAAALTTTFTLQMLPLTFDPAVWYALYGWIVLAGLAAIATYAFRVSRGGQPLFGRSLLAE